jgi:pimeloyl-ACP methyl ester carboxylesterase
MTERLMWAGFDARVRREIETKGVWMRPSAYGDGGYPITRGLIEDGRRHLIAGQALDPACPVRIIQGMQDPDVPWEGSLELVRLIAGDDVRLALVKDGEHRLSRKGDIALLLATIGELAGAA